MLPHQQVVEAQQYILGYLSLLFNFGCFQAVNLIVSQIFTKFATENL
jgi:hypothetical protein